MSTQQYSCLTLAMGVAYLVQISYARMLATLSIVLHTTAMPLLLSLICQSLL